MDFGGRKPHGIQINVPVSGSAAGLTALPAAQLSGAGAVPLATLPQAVKQYSAAGRNGAGSITLTGAKVGDLVVAATGFATSGATLATADARSAFEGTITVADQIQQSSASNLTGNTYVFLLQPKS